MKTKIIATVFFGLFLLEAHSAILLEYAFPSGVFSPTNVASGINASNINAVGSSALLEPGMVLPNSLFLGQAILSTTPDAAVENAQYFQFSLMPDSGNLINLTELAFDAGRGGGSTPRGFVLRSSVDDFSATIETADVPTVQPTLTFFSVDLTGPEFQNITTEVTFRIYGYAPSEGAGMFYDNIILSGSVSVVPEPSTATLLIGGLTFAAATLRRRKR